MRILESLDVELCAGMELQLPRPAEARRTPEFRRPITGWSAAGLRRIPVAKFHHPLSTRPVSLLRVMAIGFFCLALLPVARAADDYASLRQETIQRLEQFKRLTDKASADGIDTAREQVTITTAELFLMYAAWDAAHPAELADAVGKWFPIRPESRTVSQDLPVKQLRETLGVLEAAERELQSVMRRPAARRSSPQITPSALSLSGPYWEQNGRPAFLSSFCWMPGDTRLKSAYGDIGGVYIPSAALGRDGTFDRLLYEPGGPDESIGYVFLGHGAMPRWLREKQPEVTEGERHFVCYDIDHPSTREVWKCVLADVVPRVAGQRVSAAGYLLANEPHWFSGEGEWATGPVSDFTHRKFRAWLQKRHGKVEVLNALWKAQYKTFEDVALEVPVDTALQGTPIWYDWCRFNMQRVTEWFAFLKQGIRKEDPDAKAHIKLIPNHLTDGARSHGLDFEALVRLQDIIGCDAKVMNQPRRRSPDPSWFERYACKWRGLSMAYDFFKSIGPDKMLFDSEFHALSTVHWRDDRMSPEYVRCVYWLAHLHGMVMNQTWYWGRLADGAPTPKSVSGFYASNLTQPRVMNAFGRTMKELNAFAPEIVALATQPKQIRLFYSETSAIQDADYMDRVYESYKALYHVGLPLGFATGGMMAEASEETLRDWPVVIVSHADRITLAELDSLQRYVSNGGRLIIDGSNSLTHDEYGRLHPKGIAEEGGRIIRLSESDTLRESVLKHSELSPVVPLLELNTVGKPGCIWRTAPWQNGYLVLILNLGRGEADLELGTQAACRDLMTNTSQPTSFKMAPFGVRLLHVETGTR